MMSVRDSSCDDKAPVTFAGKPMVWASTSWVEGYGIRIVRQSSGYWKATHHSSGATATTQWDDPQRAANQLESELRERRDTLNKLLGDKP